MSSSPNELIQKVERLKEIITEETSYSADIAEEYKRLRGDLIKNPILAKTLPQFVRENCNFKEVLNNITEEAGITFSIMDYEAECCAQSDT